ncbi:nucleoside triphosphate pyrophosphohydrolase [Aequoribacter fuscus]|nr:nucleoside triphosphate pyrophosphohydrolase [Aequoribacter fuscus]
MKRLRDPHDGCPWDLKQTAQTIVPYTLEEVFELVDALERGDDLGARDELGDVLFQVVFYAQLAEERELYDFDDVIHGIVAKLLRRHPHVFPDGTLSSRRAGAEHAQERDIKERWEDIKQQERNARRQTHALDDVPLSLPALSRAQKLQKRATRLGLDWTSVTDVVVALKNETLEFEDALSTAAVEAVVDELGDLLFTCVNLARKLDLDAEQLLRQSNQKFETRVRLCTDLASEQGTALEAMSEQERDAIWREAKRQLGSQSKS